jgi:MSHA biogenesis protein MshN
MSLINQLLQDLEHRHASGSAVTGLSPPVRPLPGRSRWRTHVLLACGLVAAATAAVVLSYPGRTKPEPQVLPAPAAAAPAPARPPAPMAPEPSEETQPVLTALLPVFRMAEELSTLPEPQPEKAKPAPARKAVPRSEASVSQKVMPGKRGDIKASKPVPALAPAALADIEEVTLAQPASILSVEKQMREPTAYEQAETEFREGVARLRQGRVSDAEASFRGAVEKDRSHSAARQALVSLLIDLKRYADAEEVLRQTLAVNPRQPRHAMLLARLELERGDRSAAVRTLEAVKPFAGMDADYLSFLAAVYQRDARHEEALDAYRSALAIAPGNAVWMIGAGISLQALNQPSQAWEAFRAAADTRALTPELQAFVDTRLRELAPPKR